MVGDLERPARGLLPAGGIVSDALERTIATVAARRLGGIVDHDTSFELLGLDSLATIELAAALEAELGCTLPADALAECRNVRSLAERIARDGITRPRDDPFEQMFVDAVLPDDVRPEARSTATVDLRQTRTILLTGATGFLGGALLNELLAHTPSTVVCLVRDAATARFGRSDRIRVVQGDLSHPRLGLSVERFEHLAGEIDAVVHCGAAVNWVFSYAGLRAANVLGTLELLRLACRGGAAFHFVSSLSVCYPVDGPREVDERFDALTHLRGVHLGYAQTKVVAEALVREAGTRGLPIRIYRPALISGHSVSGAYNRDDLIATLVRGCVSMRTAPDLDWKLDALPVDTVARSIVELSKEDGLVPHIAHPRPRHWRECVLWMRMRGYDVRLISYPAWARQLEREVAKDTQHPLRPLRSFFSSRPSGGRGLTLPELYEERRRTSARSDATQARLATSRVVCPPLDAMLLETYFDAFIRKGDLPPVGPTFGSGVLPTPLPTLILDTLRESGHRVQDVEVLSTGSDHSIVSELTAWRSRRPTGLFRTRLTLEGGERQEVMVKLKAADEDVIAVGEALADVVDPGVGDAYRRWRRQVGFVASHRREVAIFREGDPRFRAHTPKVFATVADDQAGIWMIVQEYIADARLIDSAHDDARWAAPDIAAAIDGLARLQSIWFGRDRELLVQPWIGHVHTSASMREMADLWAALAQHAAPFFSSWADPDLTVIHRRLVDDLPNWWNAFDASPRSLIHNDFNPRNICLRGDGSRLCAYDWELATIGAPQRDLAEFLCFVLPATDAKEVTRWVEHHRQLLQRDTGADLDPEVWNQGFRSSLYDLLVNRLSIYAMVNRVRPQPFLPRVIRTWREMYRHVGEVA